MGLVNNKGECIMIPGETILSGAVDVCTDCKRKLKMKVCLSAAGYYVGTWCDCGPYSRETGYMSKLEAEKTLKQYNNNGFMHNMR